MIGVLVGRFEPNTPEWHQARATGLGGSEIAAVLGQSPWESRFSLWHRKVGTIGPVDLTEEMEWGTRLEDAIATKFADEHPDLVVIPTGTYRHPEREWQIGNPDRLLSDGDAIVAVLEMKFSLFGDGWGPTGTQDIPPHVRMQLQWYMSVLGLPVAYIALLVGGYDYREYEIEFDPTEVEELLTAGAEFLESIANGEVPDIDQHSATYSAVRELHPEIDGSDVLLDNDLAYRFLSAKALLGAAEDEWKHARSLVANAMGNAQRATWDGFTVATRQARGDGTPYVVVGRKLPSIEIPERTST